MSNLGRDVDRDQSDFGDVGELWRDCLARVSVCALRPDRGVEFVGHIKFGEVVN